MQTETEQVLQQHDWFLCGTKMAFIPRIGWKATGVQVELLRLPEQMAGVRAIKVCIFS